MDESASNGQPIALIGQTESDHTSDSDHETATADDQGLLVEPDAVQIITPRRGPSTSPPCDWRLLCCAICWLLIVAVIGVLLIVLAVRSTRGSSRASVLDWPAAELGENETEAAAEQATWRALAAALAESRDSGVDVCTQGFYARTCGGWDPDWNASDASESSFSQTANRIETQLLRITQQDWPLIGAWYHACMNATARRAESLDSLQQLLNLASAVNSPASWARAVALLHRAGVSVLFDVFAAEDPYAPHEQQWLYLDQTEPLVPYAVWRNNASALAIEQRRQVVELVDAMLGESLGDRALRVEEELLAPWTLSAAERRHAPEPALQDRQTLPGGFDWTTYWSVLFPSSSSPPDQVAVTNDQYLAHAAALTSHSGGWLPLRAYLLMRVLVTALPDLAPAENSTASADECLESVEMALGDQLGHYYVRQQFDESSRGDIEQMIHDVLQAFGARIRASEWMDAITRQRALEKLDAIRPLVAYPDSWALDSPPFAVRSCCHMTNVMGWRAAAAQSNLESWSQPAPRYHWLMRTYEVNAYYSPPDNDVVFPAGILQGPFYHRLAPLALNYGGLGAVCGHEVTHAFDDQGREYDADGVLRDWWTVRAAQEFEQRAQCVVDLYSSYHGVGNESVDGSLTLGENLADLGGMATARDAYAAALQRRYPTAEARSAYEALVQREFGMTHEQLFYTGYAYTWCAHVAPDRAYTRLTTDPHSPPRWRVDGPTSQSVDWAQAFSCTANASACVVW